MFIGLSNWPWATDGYLDLNWPLDWTTIPPHLVAWCVGGAGRGYRPVDEYDWFLQHYAYRVLPGPLE
ncbi:MAG: hypothetical protein U1D55_18975 [Phycisphaerae bacterium]